MHLSALYIFTVLPLVCFSLPSSGGGPMGNTFHHEPMNTDSSRPTVKEAAVSARELVFKEKIGTVSTIYPESFHDESLRGIPIGLMEYYADCSPDGNPTMLAMNVATSFRNAAKGAPITLSLRETPSGDRYSPVARPRLALMGRVVNVTIPEEQQRVKECYLARHPEAKWWVPGTGFHGSYWVKLEVQSVYWIGGFGNVAYVGFIPADMYRSVSVSPAEASEESQEL